MHKYNKCDGCRSTTIQQTADIPEDFNQIISAWHEADRAHHQGATK